jgi:hypothetical protein
VRGQSHLVLRMGTAKMDMIEFISIKSWAVTGEDEPGMREGTTEVPHPIAAAHLPEAVSVFDAATALAPA